MFRTSDIFQGLRKGADRSSQHSSFELRLLVLAMSCFQPGGSAEKASILAYLTQPHTDGPSGVVSNQMALRKWERLFHRCKELGLQIPDLSLLIRGLDTLGRLIGNKSPTAGWRLYSFRHQHQLHVQPTEQSALKYCQLLTAELGTHLAQQEGQKQQRVTALQAEVAKASREHSKAAPKTPNLKPTPNAKTPSPKHPHSSLDDRGICKFFCSPTGCRYGRSCMHPHEQLNPADGRCFNCGASGHSMQECERPSKPKNSGAPPKATSGGSVPSTPAKAAQPKRKPKSRKMEAVPEAGTAPGSRQALKAKRI